MRRADRDNNMDPARLEAFSDGVLAILITIMVLDLKVPKGITWDALLPMTNTLLCYVLSFVYLGIYWNNHHHMFHLADRVNGRIMWANMHLLFWLSLVPFVTEWVGANHFARVPAAAYGFVLLMAGIAYWLLQAAIIQDQGRDSKLRQAIGKDLKGKASPSIYTIALLCSFINGWVSMALYALVAAMWFIPDPRIESKLRT